MRKGRLMRAAFLFTGDEIWPFFPLPVKSEEKKESAFLLVA
jgi:hypothetical protein